MLQRLQAAGAGEDERWIRREASAEGNDSIIDHGNRSVLVVHITREDYLNGLGTGIKRVGDELFHRLVRAGIEPLREQLDNPVA